VSPLVDGARFEAEVAAALDRLYGAALRLARNRTEVAAPRNAAASPARSRSSRAGKET
jgi:hypothetical protein